MKALEFTIGEQNYTFAPFIHIQTIDACNAKCIFCPYDLTEHSHKMMDDEVFLRIVEQIRLLKYDPIIFLYHQNEPLLDKYLTKRAAFIKRYIKNAEIRITTNGILLPKWNSRLLRSDIKLTNVSLYGGNAEELSEFTKTKITDEQYDGMMAVIKGLQEAGKIEHVYQRVKDGQTDGGFISRGGFFSGKTLHKRIKGCSKFAPLKEIRFNVNGDMILCMMDWKKEQVFGNIMENTLSEIMSSEKRKNIIDKVYGKIESEEDFICKRCECAIHA